MNFIKQPRKILFTGLIPLTLVLVACQSGGGGSGSNPPPAPPAPPQPITKAISINTPANTFGVICYSFPPSVSASSASISSSSSQLSGISATDMPKEINLLAEQKQGTCEYYNNTSKSVDMAATIQSAFKTTKNNTTNIYINHTFTTSEDGLALSIFSIQQPSSSQSYNVINFNGDSALNNVTNLTTKDLTISKTNDDLLTINLNFQNKTPTDQSSSLALASTGSTPGTISQKGDNLTSYALGNGNLIKKKIASTELTKDGGKIIGVATTNPTSNNFIAYVNNKNGSSIYQVNAKNGKVTKSGSYDANIMAHSKGNGQTTYALLANSKIIESKIDKHNKVTDKIISSPVLTASKQNGKAFIEQSANKVIVIKNGAIYSADISNPEKFQLQGYQQDIATVNIEGNNLKVSGANIVKVYNLTSTGHLVEYHIAPNVTKLTKDNLPTLAVNAKHQAVVTADGNIEIVDLGKSSNQGIAHIRTTKDNGAFIQYENNNKVSYVKA